MKRIAFLVLLLLSLATASHAQNFNDIYQKYKKVEGVQSVKISPFLFNTATAFISFAAKFNSDLTEEDRQALKLLRKINGFQLLNSTTSTIDFHEELGKTDFLKHNNYKLLLETSDTKQDIWLYSESKKDSEAFSNIIIVTKEKNKGNSLLAYVKGKIYPEDISRLIVLAQNKSKK